MEQGHRNRSNIKLARRFRQAGGVSEQVVWNWLRNKRTGFHFRRQHPIEKYVLDFYCADAMLCFEVDGEIHQSRVTKDSDRDRRLGEIGVETIRVPSFQLFDPMGLEVSNWLDRIVDLCEERTGQSGFRPWRDW